MPGKHVCFAKSEVRVRLGLFDVFVFFLTEVVLSNVNHRIAGSVRHSYLTSTVKVNGKFWSHMAGVVVLQ